MTPCFRIYRKPGIIVVLFILIFKFLEKSLEEKIFGLNYNMNFVLQVYILFSPK